MNNDERIIALISCSKSKKSYKCKAKELYSESELFKLSYLYAKTITNNIYILSAKYGLVSVEDEVEPYEKALATYEKSEKKIWSNAVLYQLSKISDLSNDKYCILAGRDYYEDLIVDINKYELPLGRLRYGERIKYLTGIIGQNSALNNCSNIEKHSNNKVYELHQKINSLKKYSYSDINNIEFENGIYFFFEVTEKYRDLDRVVRVGTHRSQGRLKNRLKDHYKQNKDGSIFRKNIGRAILSFEHDEYLKIWDINFSDSKNSQNYNEMRNIKKERILEDRISKYLNEKLRFACINVKDINERLRLEEAIIATLNIDDEFKASSSWAGRFSPEQEIRNSGMWIKQGLDGDVLTDIELDKLYYIVEASNKVQVKVEFNNKDDIVDTSRNNIKSAADIIREKITGIFEKNKIDGKKYVTLISGEINKELGFKPHRHAQISKIMWEFYNDKYDEIENTTPSGTSSTISISYDLTMRI